MIVTEEEKIKVNGEWKHPGDWIDYYDKYPAPWLIKPIPNPGYLNKFFKITKKWQIGAIGHDACVQILRRNKRGQIIDRREITGAVFISLKEI